MIIERKRYKGLRVWKVKGAQEYLYVFHDQYTISDRSGLQYDAYGVLVEGQKLPNVHTIVSDAYLRDMCTELSYKKLPADVQKHLLAYVSEAA